MRIVGIIFVLLLYGCEQPRHEGKAPRINITSALGAADAAGFDTVRGERAFFFPKDHGPHSRFRQEWWYFTGHLYDDKHAEYGFQATFFRVGLSPEKSKRPSAWSAQNVFMAHFAVTDVANKKFYATERFARDAINMAGAKLFPFRVWVEDWQLSSDDDNEWPWQLRLQQKDVALNLSLERKKREVLQGENGMSRRSASGKASYYYSIPRVAVKGTMRIENKQREVKGQAWLDREWSTSALSKDQVGWDWFSLQLNDKTEIMYYRYRREDGSSDPASQGTFINYNNESRPLHSDDVSIDEMAFWQSPRSGVRYPSHWKIHLKSLRKSYELVPLIEDQELNLSVRYWEGAVRILDDGRDVGRGYVELVGYGG